MVKCRLLIALVLLPLCLYSFDFIDHRQAVAKAAEISLENYPNADTVLIDQYQQVQYNKNGTYKSYSESYYKILTENGRKKFSTLSTSFTIPYQLEKDCLIPLIEIIKPNGECIYIDIENNSKTVISPDQMNSNIYDPNSKNIEVNVSGLEINDIIHFTTYDYISHPRFENQWYNMEIFEATNPIIHATYEIIGSTALPIKKTAIKNKISDSIKTIKFDENKQHYIWELNNIPQYFPETNMPNPITVLQRISASSIDEWEEFSRWYYKLCEKHLQCDDIIIDKATELTTNLNNTEDKIKSLFYWVAQNIRYAGIIAESETPGYEPHDVTMTFHDKMGVCRDKAALLVAMLKAADIEAFPVLVSAGYKLDHDIPLPYFNHAIVAAVDKNGKYILMDPTDETTKDLLPSYLNNASYLIAHPKGKTLLDMPTENSDKNSLTCCTSGTINAENKLEATTHITLKGINDNLYRSNFLKMELDDIENFLYLNLQQSFPGAKLKSWKVYPEELLNTEEELTITIVFEQDNAVEKLNSYTILPQPLLSLSPYKDSGGFGMANFIFKNNMKLDSRSYDLILPSTCKIYETTKILIHDSIATGALLPDFKDYEDDCVAWKNSAKFNIINNGDNYNELTVNNEFNIKDITITPSKYLQIKELLKTIENDQQKLIFLSSAKNEEELSDINILEKTEEIALYDDDQWRKTTYIKKKINNYAGKKNHSEIKIYFNSDIENIFVKDVSVTNPDGKVYRPHDKAINIMDDPRVTTAPKYNNMKIMVINLTGVDIGSIIEYKIEADHHRTLFINCNLNFCSHYPIKKHTLSLIAPEKHNIKYIMYNGDNITKKQKDSIISWEAHDLKSVKQENFSPPIYHAHPTLWLYKNNWEDLSKVLCSKILPLTENNSKCRNYVKTITSRSSSPLDIVNTIRNEVAKNIRYIPLTWHDVSLDSFSSADATLSDGYGHNVDRAILLYTLLKECDLEPELILTSSWPLLESIHRAPLENYAFKYLENIIVKVKVDNKNIYLNSEDQYDYIEYTPNSNSLGLNLKTARFEEISTGNNNPYDSIHTHYNIEILPNGGAYINIEKELFNNMFGYYHKLFEEFSPEELKRYSQGCVSSISQSARVIKELQYDFESYPAKVSLQLYTDNYTVLQNELLYFSLPEVIHAIIPIYDSERENDIYTYDFEKISVSYTIKMPAEYQKIISLPKKMSWKLPHNGGKIDIASTYKNNIVYLNYNLELSPTLYNNYEATLIKDINTMLNKENIKIILLKK